MTGSAYHAMTLSPRATAIKVGGLEEGSGAIFYPRPERPDPSKNINIYIHVNHVFLSFKNSITNMLNIGKKVCA